MVTLTGVVLGTKVTVGDSGETGTGASGVANRLEFCLQDGQHLEPFSLVARAWFLIGWDDGRGGLTIQERARACWLLSLSWPEGWDPGTEEGWALDQSRTVHYGPEGEEVQGCRWVQVGGCRWVQVGGCRWVQMGGCRRVQVGGYRGTDGYRWVGAREYRWVGAGGYRWVSAGGYSCADLVAGAQDISVLPRHRI